MSDVVAGLGMANDEEARAIRATCGSLRVMSVYVPNGRSLIDPHYQYKLGWLDRLSESLESELLVNHRLVVAGDFNVAPDSRDLWSTAAFEGATHASGPERDRLSRLQDIGLVDLFRSKYDDGSLFSWWDYRGGSFHKGQGMRIDLILGTNEIADATSWALIDRNQRKGVQPSDHAPVIVEIDI